MQEENQFDITGSIHRETPYRQALKRLFANRQWLASHIEELMAAHADRWLLVRKESVQAVGNNPEELGQQSDAFDPVEDIILLIPKRVPQPI